MISHPGPQPVPAQRAPLYRLVAVAAPPCVAVGLVAGVVLLEAVGIHPWARPQASTVSEAAALGAAARAVELIAAGQNPNVPARIPAGVLDAGAAVELPAIDAAILGRRAELVGLLQRHGGRTADRARSICYARGVGLGEVLPYLGLPEEAASSSAGVAEVLRQCGS